MPESVTAGPATAAAATQATGAPATAPAAPAQSAGQAGQAAAGQEFIQVPKDAFKDYGGDWHKARADLTAFNQVKPVLDQWQPVIQELMDMGLTPQEAVARWNATIDRSQAQPPAATGQDQPGSQAEAPLTIKQIETLLEARESKARQDAAMQQQQAAEATARQFEANEGLSALKNFKLEMAPDGNHKPEFKAAWWYWGDALNQAKAEAVPAYAPNRDAMLRQQASPQMIARAKEIFMQSMTDLRNALVAQFASGQTSLPATLGGGPSGTAPVDRSKWTNEQRLRWIATGKEPGPA